MNKSDKPREDSAGNAAKVILSVSGGVPDLVFKPTGVAVLIYDYDVDGNDHTDKDPDGERCVISNWSAEELIRNQSHWPTVKDAQPDIACSCQRKWQCPDCNEVIELSYEEIVEVGTPLCRNCETEMNLM